ncbi:restriction endonuclease subunit S [Roseovarius sp.]|jgi:type I restriction enzyme S subunit
MTELPSGWATARLSDVCDINPRVDKSAFEPDTVVSFVAMPAVEAKTGKIDVSETRTFAQVKQGYTPFRKGDVLFAKITPCMENGKMAIVPKMVNEYGFGSTEFHVLRPAEGMEPKLIYHLVSNQGFRYHAEHNMTGAVGQKRVPAAIIEEHELGLPPTKEQRRIVEKIEAMFDEIDKGVESLQTARTTLGLYRQSLLKSAFEGRLTADWRAQNADKLEAPETLLARIQAERDTRYKAALDAWQDALSQWRADGEKGRKPAKPKRPRDIPAKATDIGIHGWTMMPLGLLIDEPAYGTSKKSDYDGGSKGVLRIPNIAAGVIDATDLKSSNFDEAELEQYRLIEGDVLTIRSNGSLSLVGKPALVRPVDTQFVYAGYLIRLRPIAGSLVPKNLVYLMMEPTVRGQIENKAKSTSGVNNINAKELQELQVPICSADEQSEIVCILDARLEAADALEAEIDAALTRADALRQSILKKAFSGHLVPQDPNDEPASTLLARIKAERLNLADGRRPKKARTTKQKETANGV